MTTTNDIFDLSPEEFRQQEEAGRRAEQERLEAAEFAAREKAAIEAHKKEQAAKANMNRWIGWLTSIGARSDRKFEITRNPNNFRPADLWIEGVRVPVSQGFGRGTSLEINLQWHTTSYNSYTRRNNPPDKCVSRMKKDGSFNYPALAVMAVYYVEAEKKYLREQGAKAGATSMIDQLKVDLGYSNMEPSTDPAKPVQFKFSVNRNMTETEARVVYAELARIGLIRKS